MNDGNTFVHTMEELLAACSRSIIAPDRIIVEANRLMSIMNDDSLEQKYVVEGCESLSLIASSFIRGGYEIFSDLYYNKTGLNHRASGFSTKDDLVRFCEFCVEYGDECLSRIRIALLAQLEIENSLSKDEIFTLNDGSFYTGEAAEPGHPELAYSDSFYQKNSATVQDQITDFIKLSMLVNSLKGFFKEYYRGLN
ncbi:hypothetical protein FRZ06_13330 [Anoxybacterium hadale]|uniref:Uncharacterized protein n=1 Tax=Anoxybacterium hadale TaxID=3408580 RepID=A0ACD1ACX0_9FIRM|nr:hypothetical protein FRZ06_13330 [Clostridiales bacterium]